MSPTSSWKTLSLQEDAPQLLVKTRFDDKGYHIQLTDLGRVWGETLTKDAIIRRASEEGCSIDPSEDDQYAILLDKISSAFDGGKDTTLRLMPSDNGSEISLDISAELPGSLPTFQWYPQLKRLPDSALSSHLLTPLLLQAYHLQHNIQQLIDEIAAKDRVIAKITDRLETSGNDLTTVFPGVSNVKTNRKRPQREQLASHVKGLADFDESAWRVTTSEAHETQDLSSQVLNVVLKDLSVSGCSSLQSPNEDDWWRNHGTLFAGAYEENHANGDPRPSKNASNHSTNGSAKGTKDEDTFQRQSTPPHIRPRAAGTPSTVDDTLDSRMDIDNHHPTIEKPAAVVDDTTDDEDDLDAVPSRTSSQTHGRSQQHEEPPAKAVSKSPAPRKLGTMGGKKKATPSTEPSPSPPPKQEPPKKGKLGAFGGKAKTKTPEPEPQADHEPQDVTPPKPKTKLGAFGGKAKTTSETTTSTPAKPTSKLGKFGGKKTKDTADANAITEVSQSSPRKLGMMGGRGARADSTSQPPLSGQEDGQRQSRPLEKQEEVEQERENSEERADNKRQRLKREMEEKAKAPVKKKRKF